MKGISRWLVLVVPAIFTLALGNYSFAQESGLLDSEILQSPALALKNASIADTIVGKSAKERADIKATEIAKLDVTGTYTRDGTTIEIRSIEKFQGGVQIIARASKVGKALGLGPNGTTEWERFLIHNPPILVPDPEGGIERVSEVAGFTTVLRYREDPAEAIRQTLAHAISVTGKEGAALVPGSIGNTTSTFYPDAHPESTSVDGWVQRNNDPSPGPESWATIRAGSGTGASDADSTIYPVFINTNTTGDAYDILDRGIFLFDTSDIPDTDTVTSATFSFASSAKYNNAGFTSTSSLDPHVVSSTPASNTSVTSSDYGQLGATSFGSVAYDNVVTDSSTYNDITLDANGIAVVSKTGVTKYGIRGGADFSDTSPAHTVAGNNASVHFIMADTSGTSADPKLVIVHSSPLPTAPTSLLTNGQVNPTNLAVSAPEFSAIYNDPNTSDVASNYRIQVSTSSEFTTTYWDSGKTTLASSTPQGTRTGDIVYSGSALAPSTTYYWRIRFWDTLDNEGAWSTETATFSVVAALSKVRKAANESLSNSTLLQSDDELRVAVGADTSYVIDGIIFATSSSATPDIVIAFSAPTDSVITVGYTNDTAEEALLSPNATSSRIQLQGNGTPKSIHFKGTIKTSSTGGDVVFKWAQATSHAAETTVSQGSYLRVDAID